MLDLQKVDEVAPVCHHCEEELGVVWFRELKSLAGRRYIYFCPNCRAILGISHRKGFFMG